MECKECGADVPDAANFCPTCGTSLAAGAGASAADTAAAPVEHGDADHTTSSIDLGELDPSHDIGDLPELAPGTAMLVVVRGPNAGSRYLLDREETSVGRHPDADIFLDDVTVSRRHAVLRLGARGVELTDKGSLNGTYVNGERVDERNLATGDEVQVGRFKLLFIGGGIGGALGGGTA